jgi:serine/threonine protein kinase
MGGSAVIGRYELKERLGSGGIGDVWRASVAGAEHSVAVKLLKPSSDNADIRKRFEREAEALASVNHPGVVSVHEFGADAAGRLFLAMDYVEGTSLREVIARGAPFALDAAESIVRSLADALDAAHLAGVIHRDLKPENVVVRRDGSPVLLDFGIATTFGPERWTTLTGQGQLLGTPGYIAPEQARGEPVTDPAIDYYALGVIWFELICGRAPFSGRNPLALLVRPLVESPPLPSTIRPDVPKEIEQAILHLLHRDPARRVDGIEWLRNSAAATQLRAATDPRTNTQVVSLNPNMNTEALDGWSMPGAAPANPGSPGSARAEGFATRQIDGFYGLWDAAEAWSKIQVRSVIANSRRRWLLTRVGQSGLEEIAGTLEPSAGKLLTEPPPATQWALYSDLVSVDRAIFDRVMGGNLDEMRDFGHEIAVVDLKGLYASVFSMLGRRIVSGGFPLIWNRVWSITGGISTEPAESGELVHLRGLVLPRYMCAFGLTGFMDGALTAVGLRLSEVAHTKCAHDGDEHCTWAVRYQP